VSQRELRPGRRAFVFLAVALLWSVALLVAAVVAPVYSPTGTLVSENGSGVLFVVAVPALLSLIVWVALWHRCLRGGRASTDIAWLVVSVLSIFCLLAILSIGIFVAPVAVLLACAVSATPPGGLRRCGTTT
jgi:hypothetical protein